MSEDEWVLWDADKPPAPGSVLRLRFVNGVISNPITIVDGRGLAWATQGYSWGKTNLYKRINGLRISGYQLLKDKKDESR